MDYKDDGRDATESYAEEKKLNRQLILSQIKQTEILYQQKNFNEIIAVATIIIAFGVVLDFFNIKFLQFDNWFSIPILILRVVIMCFFIFVIAIIFKSVNLPKSRK